MEHGREFQGLGGGLGLIPVDDGGNNVVDMGHDIPRLIRRGCGRGSRGGIGRRGRGRRSMDQEGMPQPGEMIPSPTRRGRGSRGGIGGRG